MYGYSLRCAEINKNFRETVESVAAMHQPFLILSRFYGGVKPGEAGEVR